MVKTSAGDQGGPSALAGFEKKLLGRDPEDSAIPSPLRKAARLMLGGALVTLLLGVFWIVVELSDKNALTDANGKKLTNGQLAGGIVEIFLLQYLIPAAIWVLMARFNRAGQVWARIVASVLCAIDTYLTFGVVNGLRAGQTITVADIVLLVFWVVSWVIGVIAIALVWRGESSVYYRERSARR